MNVADSEVVAAIMQTTDAELSERWEEADIILLNTCSIRDNAEQKVEARLRELKAHIKNGKWKISNRPSPILGVIGCMAERMGQQLIEDTGTYFYADGIDLSDYTGVRVAGWLCSDGTMHYGGYVSGVRGDIELCLCRYICIYKEL